MTQPNPFWALAHLLFINLPIYGAYRRDLHVARWCALARAAGRPVFLEASGNMRLETVRAYATLGEMAGALREVWGEHKEPLVF